MLMKTQGRMTECRLKNLQFLVDLAWFSRLFHPNPSENSEGSIRLRPPRAFTPQIQTSLPLPCSPSTVVHQGGGLYTKN